MIRTFIFSLALLLLPVYAIADKNQEESDKLVSGMSIVGNDEAPKALVIVPWKSSDLGDTLDVSKLMDNGRHPVDREVFGRALGYYEIRKGSRK